MGFKFLHCLLRIMPKILAILAKLSLSGSQELAEIRSITPTTKTDDESGLQDSSSACLDFHVRVEACLTFCGEAGVHVCVLHVNDTPTCHNIPLWTRNLICY